MANLQAEAGPAKVGSGGAAAMEQDERPAMQDTELAGMIEGAAEAAGLQVPGD